MSSERPDIDQRSGIDKYRVGPNRVVINTDIFFLHSDIDQPALDRTLNLWRSREVRPDIALYPHNLSRLYYLLKGLDWILRTK